MAHTPGPWHVERDEIVDSRQNVVAIRWACRRTDKTREADWDVNDKDAIKATQADANARLIAAAPDLLAALKLLVGRSENGDIIEPGWYEVEIGRAAIDKATEA